MEEIKTDGFYDRENDRKHVFIPPAPTETERGGITAKTRATESLEVTVDPETGKAYVALDSTLSKTGEAADSAEVGKKITELSTDISTKITKFYASSQGETHLADSDNGKIVDMMVYGKSEQKQYTGKNLIDIDTYYSALKQGDGTYKGTASDFSSIWIPVGKYVDTQINISCKISVPLETTRMYFLTVINNSSVSGQDITAGKSGTLTITITPKTEKDKIKVSYGEGNLGVTVISEFQIEKGSEATSYEPYTGGIPSPNPSYPQEIKSVVNPTVKVCGKNLFKPTLRTTTLNGITCTNNGNGTYTLNGTATSVTDFYFLGKFDNIIKMRLDPSEEYVLKGTNNSKINLYTGTASSILGTDNGGNIKISNMDGVAFVFIRVNNGAIVDNFTIYPQLELGSTPTAYEPYHEQTVTLPYTLNAIPVNSGGNVTIDGQQYVSDYFDVERGKLVRMVGECNGNNMFNVSEYGTANIYQGWIFSCTEGKCARQSCACSHLILISEEQHYAGTALGVSHSYDTNNLLGITLPKSIGSVKQYFIENNVTIFYQLETPIEIDLTEEEIAAFKALATYYPVTNISINSEELDGYTVFNYPISMQNGWNYVKQQIGDTRDYIYDMDARTQDTDLQAAEAYVNSEYAVALTELEV